MPGRTPSPSSLRVPGESGSDDSGTMFQNPIASSIRVDPADRHRRYDGCITVTSAHRSNRQAITTPDLGTFMDGDRPDPERSADRVPVDSGAESSEAFTFIPYGCRRRRWGSRRWNAGEYQGDVWTVPPNIRGRNVMMIRQMSKVGRSV